MKRFIVFSLFIIMLSFLVACSSSNSVSLNDNIESTSGNDLSGLNEAEDLVSDTSAIFELTTEEIITMASSDLTVAAIKSDNSLWMWGNNSYGQIGNGTVENVSTPTKILDDVTFVAVDRYYSAAIRSDNSLWIWGSNRYGQLGNKELGNNHTSEGNHLIQTNPIKIMDDVACVGLGESNVGVIKSDSSLWVWGQNDYGQIGSGVSPSVGSFEPSTKILDEVKSVCFGDGNVIAIQNDGSLWTWGANLSGTIGDGSNGTMTEYFTTPVKVLDNTKMSQCAGFWGFQDTLVIKNDNTLWMWGANQYGQIGSGDIGNGTDAWNRPAQTTPICVLDNINTASISRVGAKNDTIANALSSNGELFSWGVNDLGQVGNGSLDNVDKPVRILSDVTHAVVRGSIATALTKDSSLWVWGSLVKDAEPVTTPIKVAEGINYVYLAKQRDIYVIKNDGKLYKYQYETEELERVFE